MDVAIRQLWRRPVLVSVEALSELASLVNTAPAAHDRMTGLLQEDHDATSTAKTLPMPFNREIPAVVLPDEEAIRKAHAAINLPYEDNARGARSISA
jgi:hypothetical protein